MSRNAEARTVVERLFVAINTRDPAACAECYAQDAVVQDPRYPEPTRGRDVVRDAYGYWFQAFPDVQVEPRDYIVEGDKVAVEWLFEGTHQGDYLSVPGSGQRVRALNVSHFTVRGDKITRDLSLLDASTLRLLEELHTARSRP